MCDVSKGRLNAKFPGRWIDRDVPISHPARSPDTTLLGFFMSGYIKDIVYIKKVSELVELKHKIK